MSDRERLMDLLLSRATEGLSTEEARELDAALRTHPDVDPDQFDLAAAAAHLAFVRGEAAVEPMPATLRQRVLEQAPAHLPARGGDVLPFSDRRETKPRSFAAGTLGWYAAAAVLVLALLGFWSLQPGPTAPAPTVAEQRTSLLEEAADVIRIAWAPPEIADYAGVTGDVVWSNERQAGFMRLRGLPANRRDVEQYQLWIVDPARDEHPIDGGVFDIPAGSDEVIVPIDAKLEVANPQAFAITLEQPGGVVVSDGPLLVVAPVEA